MTFFTVERNVLNRAVAQDADAVDLLSAVLIRGGNVDPALAAGDIAAQYPLYLLGCFAGQVGELVVSMPVLGEPVPPQLER